MNYHIKHGSAAALVLLAAGCAANQPVVVTTDFADAAASIRQAETAGAQRYSSRELNIARQELDQAREAQERGDYDLAERLAKQAEVDAELAAATAGNREMQAAVDELRASIETLRRETQRGEQP
jgi:Domain of unknown function (DUF4398)